MSIEFRNGIFIPNSIHSKQTDGPSNEDSTENYIYVSYLASKNLHLRESFWAFFILLNELNQFKVDRVFEQTPSKSFSS